MTLRASLVGGIAALTVLAASASAQNWNGFYVGANAGYLFGKSDVTTATVFSATGYFANSSVPAIATAGMGSVSPAGFTGGLGVGYNLQKGHMVYGIEGDYSYVSAKQSRTDGAVYPCCGPTAFSITQTVSMDYLATLRLRIGYANPEWMFFGSGGVSYGDVKMTEDFTDTFATASQTGSHSSSQTGWVAGAGAERVLGKTDRWSLKLEYLYTAFNTQTFQGGVLTAFSGPPIAFPTNVFTNTYNFNASIVRLGLNYRFK